MLSYSSSILIALAAVLVPCHALSKCPGISGLPGIPGRDGLKGLSDSLAAKRHNALANLKHRLFQLESVLALNGEIRKVGEKIFASNGKKADFASALQSCEEVGGTLAAPRNEEENKAIMDIVKQHNQYAYLGIRKGETSAELHKVTCQRHPETSSCILHLSLWGKIAVAFMCIDHRAGALKGTQ
uniref:Pulmonary surfactant-associated protein A-like n=1 Tax=Cyanistes caeruleus TaxID=156563 RepID=A0A8C0UH22_CYACU